MKHIIALLVFVAISAPAFAQTYAQHARWNASATIALADEGCFGFCTTLHHKDVSLRVRSIRVGDEIEVYQKGELVKSFTVRTIAKGESGDPDKQGCWISWISGREPSHYLAIVPCH